MKNVFTIVLVLTVLMAMLGCGKDGKDGTASIAISWLYDPFSYSDDNPSTPISGTVDTYYPTGVGTYSFTYQAWDNSIWSGTYTITVNEGEKGGLLPSISDGEDGKPKKFTLYCYSIGPTLVSSKPALAAAEAQKASVAGMTAAKPGSIAGKIKTQTDVDSPTIIIEEVQGNTRLVVEFRRIN